MERGDVGLEIEHFQPYISLKFVTASRLYGFRLFFWYEERIKTILSITHSYVSLFYED